MSLKAKVDKYFSTWPGAMKKEGLARDPYMHQLLWVSMGFTGFHKWVKPNLRCYKLRVSLRLQPTLKTLAPLINNAQTPDKFLPWPTKADTSTSLVSDASTATTLALAAAVEVAPLLDTSYSSVCMHEIDVSYRCVCM